MRYTLTRWHHMGLFVDTELLGGILGCKRDLKIKAQNQGGWD